MKITKGAKGEKTRESLFTFWLSNANLHSIWRFFFDKNFKILKLTQIKSSPSKTCWDTFYYARKRNVDILTFGYFCSCWLSRVSKNDGFGVRERAFRWQTMGKEPSFACLLCFAQRVLSWSVHENFCFSFSLCLFKWGEELAMTDIGGKWLNLSKGTAYICLLTSRSNCNSQQGKWHHLKRCCCDFWTHRL